MSGKSSFDAPTSVGAPTEVGAPPPLLADAMLGRLARWLRLIGYDTAYAGALSDHRVAARARAEGRVVLTRDRELARRKGIRCLLVRSQVLEEQIRQVFHTLGGPGAGATARCPHCNAPLERVGREAVRDRVPAYVWRTQPRFHRCPACDHIYWPGSHWRNVQSVLARVLDPRPGERGVTAGGVTNERW